MSKEHWYRSIVAGGTMLIPENNLAEAVDALGDPDTGPCGSCGGAKWVDDENWSPDPDDIRDRVPIIRTEGNGRIPCGSCNHGGWDEPDTGEVTG